MSVLTAKAAVHDDELTVDSVPSPRRYRPDIQGLRAIAVLLVVLYHAKVPGIRGGYVGVDVFFVISGFLITRQLYREVVRTGRISFIGFYGGRIRRLLPPATLVVLVTVLVARVVLPVTQVNALVRDVWFTAVYGINYRLAIEGTNYQQATAPPSPLQHFWSLAVEEQFYVVWPILIMVCALLGRRRLRKHFMVGLIALAIAATLYASVTLSQTDTPMAYFSIQTRAWELGLGALIALSDERLARLPSRLAVPLTWLGVAMVVTSALAFSSTTVYPGTAALVPVVGSVLLIAAGAQRNRKSAETALLERPVMQYIGKHSYSWYLWHWPLLILLPAWAGKELGWLTNVEIVTIAFWFAVLTYFLENASKRSLWKSWRWLPTGAALSGTTVIAALAVLISLPSLVGTGSARTASALKTADVTAVQAALKSSLSIGALPKNLTPRLDQVKTDTPRSSADHCHAPAAADDTAQVHVRRPTRNKNDGARGRLPRAAMAGGTHPRCNTPGLEVGHLYQGSMPGGPADGVEQRPEADVPRV